MLVLTRKLGENILIGNDISVKILNINGNRVQIGIDAPNAVTIYRQELIEKIKKQNWHSLLYQKKDLVNAAHQLRKLWRG